MERSGPGPADRHVPLADAAIASGIARSAAEGRGADRAPTLEHLLRAFGEREATPEARARIDAALRLAGVAVRPPLAEAKPGERLLLLPPGVSRGRSRGRAVAGVAALVLIIAVAVAVATLVGRGDEDTADQALSGSTPFTVATGPGVTTAATSTSTSSETSGSTAAATTPTKTETETQTTTTPSAAQRRQRAARARRAEAAAEAAARRRAAARRIVTVRLDASAEPTFLCADDGAGRTLYNGTLSGVQTIRAARVRLNVGLASTVVTVNGTRVTLPGSPAGLDISRARGTRPLALGQRPCA